jgi:hypothetical protein
MQMNVQLYHVIADITGATGFSILRNSSLRYNSRLDDRALLSDGVGLSREMASRSSDGQGELELQWRQSSVLGGNR